jgi:Uma2 family endonuclease
VPATIQSPPRPATAARPRIVFNERIRVPGWATDFDSFRTWCRSADYPEQGQVFWLGGTLWVNDDMEQAYTHSLVLMAIGAALTALTKETKAGHLFGDRMRLSHPAAELSCEPDLTYVSFDAIASGRVRQLPAATGGVIEFEGSPEMVLEVVSDSSEDKDADLIPSYFAAGITEYWVVDARRTPASFDIYRRGPDGFLRTRRRAGKLRSAVFDRSFRLVANTDPFGNPIYELEVTA